MLDANDISTAAEIYLDQHGRAALTIVRRAARRLTFHGDRQGAEQWIRLERGILDRLNVPAATA